MPLPRLALPILQSTRPRSEHLTNPKHLKNPKNPKTQSYFFAIVMPPSPVRTFNVEPPEPRRPRSSCLLSLSV